MTKRSGGHDETLGPVGDDESWVAAATHVRQNERESRGVTRARGQAEEGQPGDRMRVLPEPPPVGDLPQLGMAPHDGGQAGPARQRT